MIDADEPLECVGCEGEVDCGFESRDLRVCGIEEGILVVVKWENCLGSIFGMLFIGIVGSGASF